MTAARTRQGKRPKPRWGRIYATYCPTYTCPMSRTVALYAHHWAEPSHPLYVRANAPLIPVFDGMEAPDD